MRRQVGHHHHPQAVAGSNRRFGFAKNPYRQLTCVSLLRVILGLITLGFSGLEYALGSRYNFTWHLAASGGLYVTASLAAFVGVASERYRIFLFWHTWMSIIACLLAYPGEVGLLSLELCHDTGWCLCGQNPRRACPQNWRVVPVELSALFITTVVFVFDLLAAVVSRKIWKTVSARRERSVSIQRTMKRAKREADECLATNSTLQQQQQQLRNHLQQKQQLPFAPVLQEQQQAEKAQKRIFIAREPFYSGLAWKSPENAGPSITSKRFAVLTAAAATAATAASAPMYCYGSPNAVVRELERPHRTLCYTIDQEEDEAEDDTPTDITCSRYWWKSNGENFV